MQTVIHAEHPKIDEAAKALGYLATRLGLQALQLVVAVTARALQAEHNRPASAITVNCPVQCEHDHPETPCTLCNGYGGVTLAMWRSYLTEQIQNRISALECADAPPFSHNFNTDGIPF